MRRQVQRPQTPRPRARKPPQPQRRRGRPAKKPTASFSGRSTSRRAAVESAPVPSEWLQPPAKADFVLVLKEPRRLLLLRGNLVLRDYEVSLGSNPKGAKRRNGDGRTPEGRYVLDARNEQSLFHRSIHISYPNQQDREFASGAGIDPGGGVMIHGLPEGESWVGEVHREFDWTNGCIAVTADEMEEIWELVDDGTPIEIRP